MGKNLEMSGTCSIKLSDYKDLQTDVVVKYDWKTNKNIKMKCFTRELEVTCHNAAKPSSNMTITIKLAFLPPE